MGDLFRERKYPDHGVARCLREGFLLTGDMPTTGVFKKKPELDVDVGAEPEWLAHMAPELREELIECVRSGKDSKINQKVHDIICGTHEGGNKVERGWGEGPFTEDEISAILGDDRWVASRRFGVIQGEKCRQIDDFSRFFVNGCTTVDEHVDLDGVDQIVNIGKAWII